jgi:peptidoglycan DL-endopeptidase CwlO
MVVLGDGLTADRLLALGGPAAGPQPRLGSWSQRVASGRTEGEDVNRRSSVTAGDHRAQPWRRVRALVAVSAIVALGVGNVPAAVADKGDRAFPSEDEVAAAKAQAEQKARDVGAIKASLLLANQRLEQAAVEAEQASEAYNGAMWRLQVAKDEVRAAQQEAAQARRTVAQQRSDIGALVATSYQQGTELSALGAMMGADGPEGVLDQYAGFQGASDSLQADYDRFAAADALAQVYEGKAVDARRAQAAAADEARGLKDQAIAAAAVAQTTASQITAEKDALIRELALAQNISVELAQQRQTALEEIARERAAERARAEAQAAAKQQAAQEAAAAAKARADAKSRAEAKSRADAKAQAEAKQDKPRSNRPKPQENAPPPPPPAPAPPPPPPPTPPAPSGSGGAGQAIAFARAQLGEMYEWAAAGPDTWDCSGLMMAAWGSAGVSLPHYSAAQYYAGTPISASDLRPGDLVFWGTSSSPDSIHHVAMYLGDGMIIHAPRTGRPVSIDSMYYWIPPNLFARV